MPNKIVELHRPCPSCPSSNAYCVWEDGHGYCFSCQYFKPSKESFDTLSNEDYTYEYIPHRGISKETLRLYDIKAKINSEGKPVSIGFVYPNGAIKVRQLEKKAFTWKEDGPPSAQAGLFGRDKFSQGSHKYVTVTEGEYDAPSLYQVLRAPVVSVQSASTGVRDCSVDHSWLNSFERIYFAFDGDAPGREALARVAKLFDYNKVFVLKFTKRKDANEHLQAGEEEELRNIWYNAKPYLPETIISSFSEFGKILEAKPNYGFPYPFRTLNELTYGIRTGETVCLLAQEKVGKTTIMREILYKLLKETDDAVGAIFLEEPKLRLLQALAGRELNRPVHLPECSATSAELLSAIQSVIVRDERLHVYSHFGSDDPDVLLDTIRFLVTARGCRYILFDHITMAVSGLSGESDERRALDYLATRLEMLVKELDFSLIMVSHVNDFGQTRGSHLITKVADITIRAERDMMADDHLIRNTIRLSVPFNRFAAKSGPAGFLRLNPVTYILEEVSDVPEPANDNHSGYGAYDRKAS